MNGNFANNQNEKNSFLNRFAINLNEAAKSGKLDPVIGRDEEIRRILQILSRRTKNNPILIGEPGTGKTAIVEGLAHRILRGDVPENLKRKQVYSLDMGALVHRRPFRQPWTLCPALPPDLRLRPLAGPLPPEPQGQLPGPLSAGTGRNGRSQP